MTTYYPTLDQFWPAVRARNFVKELGENPGNYAKNMETLATIAGVHVKQMCYVNPVTFAERHFRKSWFPTANLEKILGNDTYRRLNDERNSAYISSSANWAYHKKEPIPPYVEPAPKPAVAVQEPVQSAAPEPMVPSAAVIRDGFGGECKTIMDFLAEIRSLPLGHARDPVAIKMFNYIMTIEPFLQRYPKFYDTCFAKVLEFKADQRISDALKEVLLQTENFLMRLRAPPQSDEEPWCGCKDCYKSPAVPIIRPQAVSAVPVERPLARFDDAANDCGTIYHANNTDEYGEFLEVVKDYVGGDCWAIKVNDEVLFDCYKDLSLKEQLQASILRDKIVDCPHLLFTDMFTKKKDSMIVIDMHSNAALVVKITYRASDETLTFLATSNL